jgi:hypothetical protein
MPDQFPANPFTPRGMIRDPRQFFGRGAEIERLLEKLQTMQSVSIIGERRIGKSSLLYRLSQLSGRLDKPTRIVYSALSDVKDERSLYTRLCRELGGEGDSFTKLERMVDAKRVVFCLDEFENVIVNQNFPVSLFSSLRGLAQTGCFALIVATQHPLHDLCRNRKIADSPFWNIFHRMSLGLMERSDAAEMIKKKFGDSGVKIEEQETARVIELAGRFPMFIQLACMHLFEEKAGRTRQWQAEFEQEAEPHFRHIWTNLTDAEQQAMRWMTEIGERLPDDKVIADLDRRGLVVWDDRSFRGYCPFSEAFEGYIKSIPNPHPLTRWLRRRFQWVKGGKVSAGIAEVDFERPKEEKR